MEDARPLRLLSLDGGGIRGLSSLYILREIMRALEGRVREASGDTMRPALPCEYFDLIAGTSTGGLIAVMLGTLRMDVDTCINEYIDMAPDIFPVEGFVSGSGLGRLTKAISGKQRFDPKPLERAIRRLVQKHLMGRSAAGEDTLFRFEATRDNKRPTCKVFLCATSEALGTHVRFRSYESSLNEIDDCPIWQACRATSAAPTFFPPMVIGNPPRSYVDGGLGYNNPTRILLEEARQIWPRAEVGCIVSIGTGVHALTGVGGKIGSLVKSLSRIATDTERVALEIRNEMRHLYGIGQKVYFRFNVHQGLQEVGLEEWKKMGLVQEATLQYLLEERSQIEACASQLHKPPTPSILDFKITFHLGVPATAAFTGREPELKSIRQYLIQAAELNRRGICVLYGLGGMGKTQLAIEYARLHKCDYSSIFWLDGKTEDSLLRSLLSIASRLPGTWLPSQHNIKDAKELREIAQKVLGWFSLEGNHNWLLIFDNIDKTSTLATLSDTESLATYDVTSYFPDGDRGSIIITTRLRRLTELGKPIPLDKLGTEHAKTILEKTLGKPLDFAESSDELRIVDKLCGLPLALVLAGSFLASTGVSAATYLRLYEGCWNDIYRDDYVRNDYANGTIATTWVVSYNELKRKDNGAAELLRLWGYLDNHDLWFGLLKWLDQTQAPECLRQIAATECKFLETIQTLLGYSLIEGCSDSYSMHPVVHEWIRKSVNKDGNDELFRVGVAIIGLAVPIETGEGFWTVHRRLLPHADQLSERLELGANQPYERSYFDGLCGIGDLYRDQERFDKAEAMLQRAFRGLEKASEQGQMLMLNTVNNIGSLYTVQERSDEAEATYQRILEGKEKMAGPEHISTLDTVYDMGILYLCQGRLIEAEGMFQKALKGREKALGLEDRSVLNVVHNIGNLYRKQGRFSEAEAMYKRALEGIEKVLGPEHISTLDIVDNIGSFYIDYGRLDKAEAMYERSLKGREKVLGLEHILTLNTVCGMGNLYRDQGRLGKAEEMYQRALKGYEESLGPWHISTLSMANNIGVLLAIQGSLDKAEDMFQRAFGGYIESLGPRHESTLRVACNMENMQYLRSEADAVARHPDAQGP